MPTYEYECKSCSHTFEAFQGMNDEPIKVCPECGKEVRRLINGGMGIIFKGSGFYVTDKGGKGSSQSSAKSKNNTGKSDSGNEKSPAAETSGSTTASSESSSSTAKASESKTKGTKAAG